MRFVPGDTVSALYVGDGKWYTAKVEAVVDGKAYRVHYPGYGAEKAVLEPAQVRTVGETQAEEIAAAEARAVREARKARKRKADTLGGGDGDDDGGDDGGNVAPFVVPPELELLPTDPPAERERKTKKVHKLRKKHKKAIANARADARVSSWQSFVAGSGSRAAKRAKKAARRSQFSL